MYVFSKTLLRWRVFLVYRYVDSSHRVSRYFAHGMHMFDSRAGWYVPLLISNQPWDR
jgi:hypothetical protein